MKLILSGYEGSKKIVRASSFLVAKYLGYNPASPVKGVDFDTYWLTYGDPVEGVKPGTYVSLAQSQSSSGAWAEDLRRYLLPLNDVFIVFALDDYLLSDWMDWTRYYALADRLMRDKNTVCARLCTSDFYKPSEIYSQVGEFIQLSDKAEYSATTQYCLWRREYLIELLSQVSTPWEFEIQGSRLLNASGYKVIGSRPPPLAYPDSSALSKRWDGVNVQGVKEEEVVAMIELGLLNQAELVNRGLSL
jgi:hypothetical protein